jgi:hypothetical protein
MKLLSNRLLKRKFWYFTDAKRTEYDLFARYFYKISSDTLSQAGYSGIL